MFSSRNILIGLVGACLAATAAFAGDIPLDMKTGLWEVTTTTSNAGKSMLPPFSEADLAKMPPAQRARFKALIDANSGKGTALTTKSCVTDAQLKDYQYQSQSGQSNERCTHTMLKQTAHMQQIKVVCTGMGEANGVMEVNAPDREHMTTDMTLHMLIHGKRSSTTTHTESKWISSDCGDLAPLKAN